MNPNSFLSPYTVDVHPISNQNNLIVNPSSYYQSTNQRFINHKTPETQMPNFNQPSYIHTNHLNIGHKSPQKMFVAENQQRKFEAWKRSDNQIAKSMVFNDTKKETPSPIPAKKLFPGPMKLSEMARTVTNNFDDRGEFTTDKNSHFQNNSNYFQKNQLQNHVPKYGNTLAPQPIPLKNIHQQQNPIGSSMLFNKTPQKISVYKSFINTSSNNNNSNVQNKRPGGLQFLHRFKKEQQEKKQRESQNLNINNDHVGSVKNIDRNGKNDFHSHGDNNAKRTVHEHSAPSLGHFDKNYHHQPVSIHHVVHKHEDSSQNFKKRFQQTTQNGPTENSYSYVNLRNKHSVPGEMANHSQIFLKKYQSKKVESYVPSKVFNSDNHLPSQKDSGSKLVKKFSFAKKQTRVSVQSQLMGDRTPGKEKFVTPAFFKNYTKKMYSDTKTVETTPSPSSHKRNFDYVDESPTNVKSTLSDDGNDQSLEYIDGDLSSEEARQWCLNDFELGDKLGKGAFGDVFIAREKHLGFICVLKKMSKRRIKQQNRQQHVICELKIQLYLNHKHLTQMYGYFHDSESIYLILQYLPDGNLSQSKRRKRTSQKQTAQIVKQVCEGLSYMHKRNIIHRDIKPQNIFVNDGYMKLGDFGCSVETNGMRRTVVSCLEYSSPEQLNGECYNEKIDVWGVGVLGYELLTGRSPFEKEIMAMNENGVDFNKLHFAQQLKISPMAKDFIRSLLSVDPIDRLDIDEALQHEFITSNTHPQPIDYQF